MADQPKPQNPNPDAPHRTGPMPGQKDPVPEKIKQPNKDGS